MAETEQADGCCVARILTMEQGAQVAPLSCWARPLVCSASAIISCDTSKCKSTNESMQSQTVLHTWWPKQRACNPTTADDSGF